MNKNILVIAGEASGDLHGAALIRELRKIDPEIYITGIGGGRMRSEGMELIYHINQMAFLGFAEVVKHLPFIRKVQEKILEIVQEKQIHTAVLIDYPGFNLNIAEKLKAMGVKIVYYISPQIWAWGKGRIKKIKRLVDKMMVILPFEEQFFRSADVDVEFVGHPLLEQIENYNFPNRNALYDKLSLDRSKDILLVLPGSRLQEVKRIFPEAIKAAEKLAERFGMQAVVACSSDIDENIFREISPCRDYVVVKEHTYDLMKHARFGIIKSGTSTLEAGLFQLPMVVLYATNYLTYLIGRNLIQIDKISLVNIVAEEKVVDELIQKDVSSDVIVSHAEAILSDNLKYKKLKDKLGRLKESLGKTGASQRSAAIIYSIMHNDAEKI